MWGRLVHLGVTFCLSPTLGEPCRGSPLPPSRMEPRCCLLGLASPVALEVVSQRLQGCYLPWLWRSPKFLPFMPVRRCVKEKGGIFFSSILVTIWGVIKGACLAECPKQEFSENFPWLALAPSPLFPFSTHFGEAVYHGPSWLSPCCPHVGLLWGQEGEVEVKRSPGWQAVRAARSKPGDIGVTRQDT